jgi:hypothetical protein
MIHCYLLCTVSNDMRLRLYGKAEPCVWCADRSYGVDGRVRNRRERAEGAGMRQMDLLIGEAAAILDAYNFAKRFMTLKRVIPFGTRCNVLPSESSLGRLGAICKRQSSKASAREK